MKAEGGRNFLLNARLKFFPYGSLVEFGWSFQKCLAEKPRGEPERGNAEGRLQRGGDDEEIALRLYFGLRFFLVTRTTNHAPGKFGDALAAEGLAARGAARRSLALRMMQAGGALDGRVRSHSDFVMLNFPFKSGGRAGAPGAVCG